LIRVNNGRGVRELQMDAQYEDKVNWLREHVKGEMGCLGWWQANAYLYLFTRKEFKR